MISEETVISDLSGTMRYITIIKNGDKNQAFYLSNQNGLKNVWSPFYFVDENERMFLGKEIEINNLENFSKKLELQKFLRNFANWKQIQISASFKIPYNSTWNEFEDFRNYVKSHDYIENKGIFVKTKMKEEIIPNLPSGMISGPNNINEWLCMHNASYC